MNAPQVSLNALVLTLILLFSAPCHAQEEPLIRNGCYMVVSASGTTLGAYNETTPFIPASIFKLITALQSLQTLGESYRFPTYFLITPGIDLYIVGTGDPLFISEDLDAIILNLKKRGIKKIRNIYIDNSKYDLASGTINTTISQNPYDTSLSALGVNFNTIQISVSATGEISSGEAQTPTLPIMISKGKDLAEGLHRINIGNQADDLVQYAGQLFVAGFKRAAIPVTGSIQARQTPSRAGLFYTHYSAELREIIPAMLLYSNNFMANQIYLKNGVKLYGYPATWDKAERAMAHFLQSKRLKEPQVIVDGAGLSKENRVSCEAMIEVVQEFREYSSYLPLKKNIPLKSGTMTGVYAYAGFLDNEPDSPAFVLILNQDTNQRDALLNELAQRYGQTADDLSSTTMDSK